MRLDRTNGHGDRAAFERWYRADPDHAAIFDCLSALFAAAAANLLWVTVFRRPYDEIGRTAEWRSLADAVEKVGCWQKRTFALRLGERERRLSSCGGLRDRVELGELSEVLGCCCEVELVAGAVRTA